MRKQDSLQIIDEIWRSVTKEWLWVYRGAPVLTNEWSPSILVPSGLFFVERGEVRIEADGREIRVPAGSAFFTAPGSRRQWLAHDTLLLSVGFRCLWPDQTPLFRTGLNLAVKSHRVKNLHRATMSLFKTVHGKRRLITYGEAVKPQPRSPQDWCKHDAAYLMWFHEFFDTMHSLGITCETAKSSNERLLVKVLDCLNESPLHHANPSLIRTTSLGVGPRRVEQLMQARFGMTARAWHERRRLDFARQRLVQDTMPLKAIGSELGFRHASHFTVWFRRHNGISPSAYRQCAGHGVA